MIKNYTSYAFQRCMDSYYNLKGGLCERCISQGRYTPGTKIGYKERMTDQQLADPLMALNWDNLILLCDDCSDGLQVDNPPGGI